MMNFDSINAPYQPTRRSAPCWLFTISYTMSTNQIILKYKSIFKILLQEKMNTTNWLELNQMALWLSRESTVPYHRCCGFESCWNNLNIFWERRRHNSIYFVVASAVYIHLFHSWNRQPILFLWNDDYWQFLIFPELTIIVNLGNWELDMDYGKWTSFFKIPFQLQKIFNVSTHRTRAREYSINNPVS